MLFSTLDLQKRPTFTIGPEKTINGSSVYTIHMELREGDLCVFIPSPVRDQPFLGITGGILSNRAETSQEG